MSSQGVDSEELAEQISSMFSEMFGVETAGLHDPVFDAEDLACVSNVMQSGMVSTYGPMVRTAEASLADLLNGVAVEGEFEGLTAENVLLLCSGTEALTIAIHHANLGVDAEVFVPSLSFAASANAIVRAGAYPHFVDVDPETGLLDLVHLERYINSDNFTSDDDGLLVNRLSGRRVRALLYVSLFGSAGDACEVRAFCDNYGLTVLEDAAESLGSLSNAGPSGTWSMAGCFSFNGNKIVTSGGGGAIVSFDTDFISRCRHYASTARVSNSLWIEHDEVGSNSRMPALNAGLLYSQLLKFPSLIAKKQRLRRSFVQFCDGISGVEMSKIVGPGSNYWLNILRVPAFNQDDTRDLISRLNARGVMARAVFSPLPDQKPYRNFPVSSQAGAELFFRTSICLPSGVGLIGDN